MVEKSTTWPNRGGSFFDHIIETLYNSKTSQIIMESPALKIILRAVCLAAQAVQQNLFLVMSDDIIIPQDGRKRPRPRQVIRPSYEKSP